MTPALVALLAGANFAVALGYGAILPLLPTLLANAGGASAAAGTHTGGLTGIYMAALLVGALVWGSAANRLGARASLLVGLVGYAITSVLVAIPGAGIAMAYALRALAGFFAGAVVPVVGLLAATEDDPERRARGFAATGAATLLGFLAGPALAGGIATSMQRMANSDAMSAMTLFWSLGGAALIALGVGAAATRAPALLFSAQTRGIDWPAERGLGSRVATMLAANFVALFGLGAFEAVLPVLGQRALQLSPTALALMFAQCGALMLVVQIVLLPTRLLARVPPRALFAAGFVLMASGAAALGAARAEATAFAASALLSLAAGWLLPAISYHAIAGMKRAAALLLGALSAAGILGQAVGSMTGGWLYDRLAGGSLWLIAALLALFALAITRRTFDSPLPQTAPMRSHHSSQ